MGKEVVKNLRMKEIKKLRLGEGVKNILNEGDPVFEGLFLLQRVNAPLHAMNLKLL